MFICFLKKLTRHKIKLTINPPEFGRCEIMSEMSHLCPDTGATHTSPEDKSRENEPMIALAIFNVFLFDANETGIIPKPTY